MASLSRDLRLDISFVTSWPITVQPACSHYTSLTTAAPITLIRFRLFRFRSPLLTESLRFPLLGLLRCFSSPAYLHLPMNLVRDDTTSLVPGFPIRVPPDQSIFPAPRRISLVIAPFIGSLPQGIHHTPFVA